MDRVAEWMRRSPRAPHSPRMIDAIENPRDADVRRNRYVLGT